jgi:hypothetical protein
MKSSQAGATTSTHIFLKLDSLLYARWSAFACHNPSLLVHNDITILILHPLNRMNLLLYFYIRSQFRVGSVYGERGEIILSCDAFERLHPSNGLAIRRKKKIEQSYPNSIITVGFEQTNSKTVYRRRTIPLSRTVGS